MASDLRRALLRWYDGAARDLPWRRACDPYAIWVSEVMLQQTRVETVVPYFERFLEAFPTLTALAEASEDEVLARFSGLGYYRRARLLHAGAREVVARHAGKVPRDPAARLRLPGVGRYTAGAIGSIAFGLEEPVVDGNVARVLARLLLIDTPLGRADTDRALWAAAEALVRGPRPGALNQALMELGATLCLPATPRCGACPVRRACAARARGRSAELPVPRERKAPRPVELVAVVATRGRPRSVFLVRGEERLYGGLWGPPMAEGGGAAAARALLRAARIRGRVAPRSVGRLDHVLTHLRLRVRVYRATGATAAPADARAVSPDGLTRLGVSRLTRKILELALA